jgi:HK97 family phage prohead protease
MLQMKPRSRQLRSGGPRLARLANRIFNTPLLIEPRKLESILAVLGPHLGLAVSPAMDVSNWNETPGASVQMDQSTGICTIPIHGTLVSRSTGMDAASGLTCYPDIKGNIDAAIADPNCEALVLEFDSPGGEASGGLFELASHISSLRGVKPIIAVSADQCYSAAYCLAAACDQILLSEISGVGSIGCYMLHCDESAADKQEGLAFRYVYSGARKVDGNPHSPLSPQALAQFQQECDAVRTLFVQSVARNRSVDSQKIYDTEAACFMGAKALPLLADSLGGVQDAIDLARLRAKNSRGVVMPATRMLPASATHAGVSGSLRMLPAANDERGNIAALLPNFIASRFAEKPMNGGRILALRQSGGKLALAGSPTRQKITGILAPYNSLSCDLGGFKEAYQPGCFRKSLADPNSDPRVCFCHEATLILGRRGAGTARFWEEADGLHYECELPDTQCGRDVQALVQRGDIFASSAAFYLTKHHWETRAGQRVRVVEEAQLVEGSPHSFAAYGGASASIAPSDDEEMFALKSRLRALTAGSVLTTQYQPGPDPQSELLQARLRLASL